MITIALIGIIGAMFFEIVGLMIGAILILIFSIIMVIYIWKLSKDVEIAHKNLELEREKFKNLKR